MELSSHITFSSACVLILACFPFLFSGCGEGSVLATPDPALAKVQFYGFHQATISAGNRFGWERSGVNQLLTQDLLRECKDSYVKNDDPRLFECVAKSVLDDFSLDMIAKENALKSPFSTPGVEEFSEDRYVGKFPVASRRAFPRCTRDLTGRLVTEQLLQTFEESGEKYLFRWLATQVLDYPLDEKLVREEAYEYLERIGRIARRPHWWPNLWKAALVEEIELTSLVEAEIELTYLAHIERHLQEIGLETLTALFENLGSQSNIPHMRSWYRNREFERSSEEREIAFLCGIKRCLEAGRCRPAQQLHAEDGPTQQFQAEDGSKDGSESTGWLLRMARYTLAIFLALQVFLS